MMEKLLMIFFAFVLILNAIGFVQAKSYTFTFIHAALITVCLYQIVNILNEAK